MQIITNHGPRPLISGAELLECEKAEFDYLSAEEMESPRFFRYRGAVYDTGEFMTLSDGLEKNWHGVSADSYFSAILIRIVDCGDSVIVARAYS